MYPFTTGATTALLELHDGLQYVRIGRNDLESYTRFVYRIFVERIGRRYAWQPKPGEFETMLFEERMLFESGFFIAARTGDGRFVGAMRAARWQPGLRLTAERIFNIEPALLARRWGVSPRSIWHVSQMCVDTPALIEMKARASSGVLIMRNIVRLLLESARHLEHEYGIMESDAEISLYLRKFLQIESWPLSPVREYIGHTFVAAVDLSAARQLPYVRQGNPIVK